MRITSRRNVPVNGRQKCKRRCDLDKTTKLECHLSGGMLPDEATLVLNTAGIDERSEQRLMTIELDDKETLSIVKTLALSERGRSLLAEALLTNEAAGY